METSTLDPDAGRDMIAGTPVVLQGGDEASARRVRSALKDEGILFRRSFEPTAGNGVSPAKPHVVIVDVTNGGSSIEATFSKIWERSPGTAIVAVVAEERRKQGRDALRAGAVGVVYDTRLEDTLAIAVRCAGLGLLSMPAELGPRSSRQPLSSREKQVLGLVVMGQTNCEIADRLFLAESTVKSHLSSAFGKLGVRSRSEATAHILDPNEGLGLGILRLPTP